MKEYFFQIFDPYVQYLVFKKIYSVSKKSNFILGSIKNCWDNSYLLICILIIEYLQVLKVNL